MNIEAPAYFQDLAANGDTTGVIQVADSSGFYCGCIGYLVRTDLGARVLIVSIPDSTHVGVRIIADDLSQQQAVQRYGGLSNLTGWTTAKASRLNMPQQLARVEPAYTKPAQVNK